MNKGKFKIKKFIFPYKARTIESGSTVIVSCELISTTEGSFLEDEYGSYTFKGVVPSIILSEDNDMEFTIIAEHSNDPRYPYTHKIKNFFTDYKITGRESQKNFLSMILTDKQLDSLYENIDDPFLLIENRDVKGLMEIKGIGEKKANSIIEKYERNKDYSPLFLGLDAMGITITQKFSQKLLDKYISPDVVLDKIRENPYILAKDIEGVGFVKADRIALDMGHPRDSIFRLSAFTQYFLEDRAKQGYSWVTPQDLYDNMACSLGDINDTTFGETLVKLHADGVVLWDKEQTQIALYYYYDLERKIAKHLIRIKESKVHEFNEDTKKGKIAELQVLQGWDFTEEQILALDAALNENACIITGFGGTGKTSSVGAMLKVLHERSFAQTALSGKASSRLQEVTGEEGYTIHRLLGYDPKIDSFMYNEDVKLSLNIIILDEGSMVGGEIFLSLIQAIPTGSKLIILGDEGQLESIGSLNVFKDMIDSEVIKTVKLHQIHRQAQKSAITTESIKVYKNIPLIETGQVGTEIRGELKDLVLRLYDDKSMTPPTILNSYKTAMEIYNDIKDITVVVPTRFNGDSSAYNINIDIQDYINPPRNDKKEVSIVLKDKGRDFPVSFRVGDRVLNKKNNRKLLDERGEPVYIYNGFVGTIKSISYTSMIIDFDLAGRVVFEKTYWINLLLGYAITGHSMQGSENKCVIIGVDYSGYIILSKEWIYTAMTRAQQLCVLCAETKALTYAVKTSRVPYKQTFLKEFLRNRGEHLLEY